LEAQEFQPVRMVSAGELVLFTKRYG
jgi:hypothetical protein